MLMRLGARTDRIYREKYKVEGNFLVILLCSCSSKKSYFLVLTPKPKFMLHIFSVIDYIYKGRFSAS